MPAVEPGEVDGVGSAGVVDHEADVMLQTRRRQLVAILRAAETIEIVARIEVDDLVGAQAFRVDCGEVASDNGLDVSHERRRGRPAAGLADVDPVKVGHDGVLLAVIDPGRVVQVVDLHAARTAVIVEPGMVQAELMAEFVDKGIEDVAADVRLVGFRVVEALTDADVAIVRIGAAVVPSPSSGLTTSIQSVVSSKGASSTISNCRG